MFSRSLPSLLLALLLALLTACPTGGDTSTSDASSGVMLTTTDTGVDPTTDPTTTGSDATTSADTSNSTATSTTGGGTTDGIGPDECPAADACDVVAPDFCAAIGAIAEDLGFSLQRIDILRAHCARETPCWVCWSLTNTCKQGGFVPDVSICDDVELECGCIAAHFGGNG